jgi:hypothetical protein
MLADQAARHELGARVAVVTPSASLEDERLVRQLTPDGVEVHMSSETWFRYGVGQAGTFVLVRDHSGGARPWEAPGEVLGSATPEGPAQLAELVALWLGRVT